MDDAQEKIGWDKTVQEKFEQLLGKIPIFLRGIAEKKVSQKAESIKRHGRRLFFRNPVWISRADEK